MSLRPLPASHLDAAARTLRKPADLAEAGLIAPGEVAALDRVAARYAVAVTPAMATLIEAGTGEGLDPIARQFLPTLAELDSDANEITDPIGDHPHSPVKGLVHRYPDRVLVKLTHSCPVYCRFCFRREMVGPEGDGALTAAELDEVFAYIADNPHIFEVIFTGGDPLMLSARRIAALGERLAAIPHVRLVRWHSRVPVVAPERITESLVRALRFKGKANHIAIHANHIKEFTPDARVAIARLADAGVVLHGQSVLLRDVNDAAEALIDLFREMVANRIRPLYLHHPDLAPGTAHFRLSIAEGRAIYATLRGQLPGHAIPAYVLDIPGGYGKISLESDAVVHGPDGVSVRDSRGVWHPYPG
jgi:lysine 2,3-aminomutase